MCLHNSATGDVFLNTYICTLQSIWMDKLFSITCIKLMRNDRVLSGLWEVNHKIFIEYQVCCNMEWILLKVIYLRWSLTLRTRLCGELPVGSQNCRQSVATMLQLSILSPSSFQVMDPCFMSPNTMWSYWKLHHWREHLYDDRYTCEQFWLSCYHRWLLLLDHFVQKYKFEFE